MLTMPESAEQKIEVENAPSPVAESPVERSQIIETESLSFFYGQSATTVIFNHIGPTLFLVVYAAVLAAAISLPIGFVAGLHRGGPLDQSSRVFFTLSFAMPAFWLGIILILIFSVHLNVFPLSGFGPGVFLLATGALKTTLGAVVDANGGTIPSG